ncbi:hypothetical protein ACP4OV_022288 [Aristida adscensionis]
MAPGRRWSDGETKELLEAWKPLFPRRRDAQADPWVPSCERPKIRSARTLTSADWRGIAVAVGGDRTADQCKRRMAKLLAKYRKKLNDTSPSQWPWFDFLHEVLAEPSRWHPAPSQPSPAVADAVAAGNAGGAGDAVERAAASVLGSLRRPHDDPRAAPPAVAHGGAASVGGAVGGREGGSSGRDADPAVGTTRIPKRPRSSAPAPAPALLRALDEAPSNMALAKEVAIRLTQHVTTMVVEALRVDSERYAAVAEVIRGAGADGGRQP